MEGGVLTRLRPMRALAVVLAVAAIGSFAVSLASHRYRLDSDSGSWTMYTPLSNEARYSEYDHMPWDDARLWLGLAIGFAVSATAVGVISLRRPTGASKSTVD